MINIIASLAQELSSSEKFISNTISLLDEGATVPFISRYRKEITGGLDDTQLRQLETRLSYLRELEERKKVVLASIESQNKLSTALRKEIELVESKIQLEDIYRPYMPKRKNKAQQAREAGLEPLAMQLLNDQTIIPENYASNYINVENGIVDTQHALEGAKQILVEHFAEDAALNTKLRHFLEQHVKLKSSLVDGKEKTGEKFKNYFDSIESIGSVPSHRALAQFRGRNEGILRLDLVIDEFESKNISLNQSQLCANQITDHFKLDKTTSGGPWLINVAHWSWKVKLSTRLETELKLKLKESAEQEAISVFSKNLKNLMMAAPAGPQVTMGLDPGFKTGVKVAIVDNTGKFIADDVIFPHPPQNRHQQAIKILLNLIEQHEVKLISIGNGTASRETDRLVSELFKQNPALSVQKIVVSEAGASIYSASEVACDEFPELDVTIRGAISIARRLQDPLAELVKIDPKGIGVGQYQHDVNQSKLSKALSSVVEDCVNAVGVDINMASAQLLAYVSGFSSTLAKNVVLYRNQHGKFENRTQIKNVPRLGDKIFEQSAGFLKIANGDMPLDASSVHPEAYPLVHKILQYTNKEIGELVGNSSVLKQLPATKFVTDKFGLPTIQDILIELEKPGRDPRPDFKSANFSDGIESINDLKPDMILEGVITNITNFGAFVDIGVHQDGLVHISAMADKFVKNPHQIVKTGDIVKVKVVEVEPHRKRIALSMRNLQNKNGIEVKQKHNNGKKPMTTPKSQTALAAAFMQAK